MERTELCLLIFCVNIFGSSLGHSILDNVAFIVMNQPSNSDLGSGTSQLLQDDLIEYGVKFPFIHRLHHSLDNAWGGWTYVNLFHQFLKLEHPTPKWFVLLHEGSMVNAKLLEQLLGGHDYGEQVFIGKALTDQRPVIIHHFQSNMEFKFPDPSAGIIFSQGLVRDMAQYYSDNDQKIRGLPQDFSIDPEFELAQAIYYRHVDSSDETPVELTHSDMLCQKFDKENNNCAIFSWRNQRPCLHDLESSDSLLPIIKKVSFSVKTCEKYHSERLPVIQETWARAAVNLDLMSEKEDAKFGTKVLPGVSHNTEKGHCMKTLAIIKDFHEKANVKGEDLDWLVIADDDTILSVAKMARLLNCYDPSKLVAIGQRYGYQVASGRYGYEYPTGGSGMVFSKALVAQMAAEDTGCKCPKPDSPDDMVLGSCLSNLGVQLVHSDKMHQARPEDYHPELLEGRDPVSFHKFWNTDPVETYKRWFLPHDKDLIDLLAKAETAPQEVPEAVKDEL